MPSASVLISSTSSFRALAEKRKIVDKSSAIRDFLQDDYPVHLLLRPRRSGKTTLLRMFQ
jgi:predicted AAA+ superfamily ATPase